MNKKQDTINGLRKLAMFLEETDSPAMAELVMDALYSEVINTLAEIVEIEHGADE